jgi:hypothetical protein
MNNPWKKTESKVPRNGIEADLSSPLCELDAENKVAIANWKMSVTRGLQATKQEHIQPSILSQALAASARSAKLMNAKPLALWVSRSLARKTLVTRPNRSNISRTSCSSANSLTCSQEKVRTKPNTATTR